MKRNMVGFMALAGLATSVFGQAPDCRSLQPDRCEFKYGIAFGVEMSVSTSVPWGDRGNPLRRSLSWAAAGVAGGGAQTVCDPAALAEGVFQSKTSASAFCATTVIGFGSQLSQADPTNPVNITQTLTSSYETGLVLFRRPVQTGPFQLECLDSGELICASSAGGVAAGGAAVSVIYDDLSGLPPVGQPLVVRTATIGYSLAIFTGIQGGPRRRVLLQLGR